MLTNPEVDQPRSRAQGVEEGDRAAAGLPHCHARARRYSPLSHTHSLSLSLTHTLTLSLSLTHTLTLSLSFAHTLSHTLSLSLSHTHKVTHTHALSLTHKHTHTPWSRRGSGCR